jgi:hypothetical protein
VIGIMEYWNIGILTKYENPDDYLSLSSTFHHSTIPSFLRVESHYA